ncbi:MAG: tripartite tricarboxylate transporter TctB family protein [Burkholderiales bacterium]|nr:tripartite tricarboxylate transporter TctB family protein [Burkholderiales bacterium]
MPRLSKTLASGALFMALGAAGLWFGRLQATGSLLRMGPGWLPRALSWILLALGAVVAVSAWTARHDTAADTDAVAAIAWRPLLTITAAVAAFGVLLERAGLIVAVLALVTVACHAEPRRGVVGPAVLALLLAALAWAIFVAGLGMPIALWPEGETA